MLAILIPPTVPASPTARLPYLKNPQLIDPETLGCRHSRLFINPIGPPSIMMIFSTVLGQTAVPPMSDPESRANFPTLLNASTVFHELTGSRGREQLIRALCLLSSVFHWFCRSSWTQWEEESEVVYHFQSQRNPDPGDGINVSCRTLAEGVIGREA